MIVYILDKNKITKFRLPSKVEELFVLKYRPESRQDDVLINLEPSDGKWLIKSNGNVNIIENGMWTQKTLEEYSLIKINIKDVEDDVYIYCSPLIEDKFSYMPITKDITQILIGKDNDCDIIFNNINIFGKHTKIVKEDNGFYIYNIDNSSIYLNKNKIDKSILKIGDNIFINGLKITFMGGFLKLNNPLNQVSFKNFFGNFDMPTRNNYEYEQISDIDSNIELYDEKEYFFHTPYLKSILEKEFVEIDSPPNPVISEDMPFILTIGTSITMIAYSLVSGYSVIADITAGKPWVSLLPSIITCTAMLIGSVIMPRIIKRYQKKKQKQREKLRQTKYTEYLDKKAEQIKMILINQSQILKLNYLSSKECYLKIVNRNKNLWQREILDEDFLTIRLGIGTRDAMLEIKAPEEHFSLDDDNLRDRVYDLVENSKKLNDIPITFNLIEKNISAIINNNGIDYKFLESVLIQLISYHSSGDLKLVFLVQEAKEEYWQFVKYLPHCFSDDKSIRFFATNIEEMKTISNYLEEEYSTRLEKLNSNNDEDIDKKEEYKNFAPYYLIISDNCKMVRDLQIITNILNKKVNLGFSIFFADSTLKNLPNNCNSFIVLHNSEGEIMEKELSNQRQVKFNLESNYYYDMEIVSQILGNIPVLPKAGASELPTSITFLEMYNVGKIEQLNILNLWQTNNPVVSLKAPVGVHANGDTFLLDLHEKVHGPHGLIAGSTGSGKSEFIITYILSMIINYHPYEVQFVLIDYKGGGLAGAFENRETGVKIPHLVGTITNLDTSEMNRTLVSIESEMKRRQIKFNEVRDKLGESTIDIYKYQKLYREGVIKEPIAHLFIVSDEFAELKKQQPEFMNQLVSTARIGRSLGIHLILATQKPSGVVNDQIWSNSKFKVCLKVQDRSDSMEVLKKPDAASIKEVGRFYLQVGYDEYFSMGQSGWAGAKYTPTDVVIKKIDDSISFIDNVGYVVKSTNSGQKETNIEAKGDQLTNITRYICNLAKKNNIETSKLWLDSIPEIIYLTDVMKKYNYKVEPFVINPVIGEYDVPDMQKQCALTLDLSKEGNTLIYGMAGSGKENLLLSLVYSTAITHSPEEVNFYVCDFGSESLKVLRKFPHVGDILLIDDAEKIVKLFNMVSSEIERRKDLFADYSGSYMEYIKSSGKTEPLMVIIINNYESFLESYNKIADLIYPFIRDGSKYGIDFIITATTISSVRSRIAQNFNNKMALKLPDDSDYRSILNVPRGLYPADKFGRGLVEIGKTSYEFQTVFICDRENINTEIKNMAHKLIEVHNNYKAPKIPVMPSIVTTDMVFNETEGLTGLPLGIERETLETYIWDFMLNPVTLIGALDIDEHIYFMNALLKELAMTKNIKVKIIDTISYFKSIYSGIYYYSDNFDNVLKEIFEELTLGANNNYNTIYIITGIGKFKDKLDTLGKEYYSKIFNNLSNYKNSRFIFVDNNESYKNVQIESWYRTSVDNTFGIWLGEEVSTQSIINIKNIDLNDKKLLFPYMAFAVYKGRYMIIKYIVEGLDLKDEE